MFALVCSCTGPVIAATGEIIVEHREHSSAILKLIAKTMEGAPTPESRLNLLYLIDAILRHKSNRYNDAISEHIAKLYNSTFDLTEPNTKTRNSLVKLFEAWQNKQRLPKHILTPMETHVKIAQNGKIMNCNRRE